MLPVRAGDRAHIACQRGDFFVRKQDIALPVRFSGKRQNSEGDRPPKGDVSRQQVAGLVSVPPFAFVGIVCPILDTIPRKYSIRSEVFGVVCPILDSKVIVYGALAYANRRCNLTQGHILRDELRDDVSPFFQFISVLQRGPE